jgi:hypothetical protein
MMRKLAIAIAALALGWVGPTAADGQKDTPQPCVILKRMGPADQVTSHLYSFGIRGKQFQYVEGQLPEGVKFHGRLTDNDVRKIQDAGGRVAVVESHFTEQALEQARESCGLSSSDSSTSGGSPKSESKSKEKQMDSVSEQGPPAATAAPGAPGATTVPPQPTAEPAAPAVAPAPAPVPEELSTAVLKSTPDGADVIVDGKFMGSTPSTVRLTPGDHMIAIEKSGYKAWQRIMSVNPGGIVTVDATLEKNP